MALHTHVLFGVLQNAAEAGLLQYEFEMVKALVTQGHPDPFRKVQPASSIVLPSSSLPNFFFLTTSHFVTTALPCPEPP